MTEMQVHEERVMNLVESSSGNPTITPLTKTNAHRAESIRRIGTDKDAVAFHFRKKSTGMYMYIHTYTETNNLCNIPLLSIPKQILEKYKDNPYCLDKGIMLPVPCNQLMNSYLKEIADLCGIRKNLTRTPPGTASQASSHWRTMYHFRMCLKCWGIRLQE